MILTGSVLSLLVALISVTGLALPPIINALRQASSALEFEVLDYDRLKFSTDSSTRVGTGKVFHIGIQYSLIIDLLAENGGERAGILFGVTLSVLAGDSVAASAEMSIDPDDAVLAPGTHRLLPLEFQLDVSDDELFLSRVTADSEVETVEIDVTGVTLTIRSRNAEGKREDVILSLPGSVLRGTLVWRKLRKD